MKTCTYTRSRHEQGVSLIEMLVTMLILMIGLLGVAALMVRAQQSEMESYQRVQAMVMLRDMAARFNANHKAAFCYAITTNAATGTPFLGVGAAPLAVCATGSASERARADADLAEWSAALTGASETVAGNAVGAMIGGRGCITLVDAATRTYQLSVAWQGLSATAAPPANLTCAKGAASLYGSDAMRRVVTMTIRVANLN